MDGRQGNSVQVKPVQGIAGCVGGEAGVTLHTGILCHF